MAANKVMEAQLSRHAYFVVGMKTNLTLKLREKVVLDGFLRQTAPVDVIYLKVDDPKSFEIRLRRRIEEKVQAIAG